MAAAPLMQPHAGGVVQTTHRDVCGGGSVAPYVDRTFRGDADKAEPVYRRLALEGGWEVEADTPGSVDGFGARKGDRYFGFRRSPSGWAVSMSQGDGPATCRQPGPDAEVTTEGY